MKLSFVIGLTALVAPSARVSAQTWASEHWPRPDVLKVTDNDGYVLYRGASTKKLSIHETVLSPREIKLTPLF